MITHIIHTSFTGRGKVPYRGDEWLKYRIKLFKKYTLISLVNQTNHDFLHWISFRPEEENNPQVKQLFKILCGLGYNCVFTFNGQPYWDDKKDNSDLQERFKKDLERLKPSIKGEYVYFTVIDSDDCFRSDVIELIQKVKPQKKKAIVFKQGYCLYSSKDSLYEWNPPDTPPFYTVIYPKDVFLNPENKFRYEKGVERHSDIPNVFHVEEIPGRLYLVVIHSNVKMPLKLGNQISTYFRSWRIWFKKHPYIGPQIKNELEKIKILYDFGF